MHITRKKLFHTIFDKKYLKQKKFFIKYLGQYNANVYYQCITCINLFHTIFDENALTFLKTEVY